MNNEDFIKYAIEEYNSNLSQLSKNYNNFSEILEQNSFNIYKFIRESNLIENIIDDDINNPFMYSHIEAFDYAKSCAKNKEPLDIKELHRTLMKEILKNEKGMPGEYRKVQVYVGNHIPPKAEVIDLMMEDYSSRLNAALSGKYVENMEWDFHNEFEYIHPFIDGNGRTGRLILNYIRKWYFPEELIVVKNENKKLYYTMLDVYEKEKK